MQAATDFLKGVGSRMCDHETLNSFLQKIDGILAQQVNPPPDLLGPHPSSNTAPLSLTVQNNPQASHGLNSTHRSDPANNRTSTNDMTYDIPQAELLNLNGMIPGTSDFDYDSLYSAMSILGDGWPTGMPDVMETFLSESIS